MTTKLDAQAAHAEIERLAAEQAVHEVRRVRTIAIGRCVRQGDVYLHRVASDHAHGALRAGAEARQLAIGQTQGSRHIAEPPAKVYDGLRLPDWCDARTFLGPCIVAVERFVVTHPEHAQVSLPAGTYQVTHQMDARSMERVRD